jgi:hypothetical protein
MNIEEFIRMQQAKQTNRRAAMDTVFGKRQFRPPPRMGPECWRPTPQYWTENERFHPGPNCVIVDAEFEEIHEKESVNEHNTNDD